MHKSMVKPLTSSVTERVGICGFCNRSAVGGGVDPFCWGVWLPTPFALGELGCVGSTIEDEGAGTDKFCEEAVAKSGDLGEAGPSFLKESLSED